MPTIVSSFKGTTKRHTISQYGEVEFQYPCSDTVTCSPITVSIPPGRYKLEAYGASGGTTSSATTLRRNNGQCDTNQQTVQNFRGNTVCNPYNSPGAGGYISGIIEIKSKTAFYVNIGGKGTFFKASVSDSTACNEDKNRPKGGYNGGGDATGHAGGSSGGGGATDIRALVDDLWHRILVAGGGGGTDDSPYNGDTDDGSGGAGGYPNGQGYFLNGNVVTNKVATQTTGFSFGQGQSAVFTSGASDMAGAGGGWFGGYASNSNSAGAGGGSSFALTKDATIPSGNIKQLTKLGVSVKSNNYAFSKDSKYAMRMIEYQSGIRDGNGLFRITFICTNSINTCNKNLNRYSSFMLTLVYLSHN